MIFLVLLLTIILYLAFPIIHTRVNGKLEPKQAKKYALLNSIVVAFITTCIPVVMFGYDFGGNANLMFAPAFFYYFIAKSIMTRKEDK